MIFLTIVLLVFFPWIVVTDVQIFEDGSYIVHDEFAGCIPFEPCQDH